MIHQQNWLLKQIAQKLMSKMVQMIPSARVQEFNSGSVTLRRWVKEWYNRLTEEKRGVTKALQHPWKRSSPMAVEWEGQPDTDWWMGSGQEEDRTKHTERSSGTPTLWVCGSNVFSEHYHSTHSPPTEDFSFPDTKLFILVQRLRVWERQRWVQKSNLGDRCWESSGTILSSFIISKFPGVEHWIYEVFEFWLLAGGTQEDFEVRRMFPGWHCSQIYCAFKKSIIKN